MFDICQVTGGPFYRLSWRLAFTHLPEVRTARGISSESDARGWGRKEKSCDALGSPCHLENLEVYLLHFLPEANAHKTSRAACDEKRSACSATKRKRNGEVPVTSSFMPLDTITGIVQKLGGSNSLRAVRLSLPPGRMMSITSQRSASATGLAQVRGRLFAEI
jgi:hypothetical protein